MPRRKPHSHRRGPAYSADIQDVLATITTAAETPSDSGRSGTAAEGTRYNCPNSGQRLLYRMMYAVRATRNYDRIFRFEFSRAA